MKPVTMSAPMIDLNGMRRSTNGASMRMPSSSRETQSPSIEAIGRMMRAVPTAFIARNIHNDMSNHMRRATLISIRAIPAAIPRMSFVPSFMHTGMGCPFSKVCIVGAGLPCLIRWDEDPGWMMKEEGGSPGSIRSRS